MLEHRLSGGKRKNGVHGTAARAHPAEDLMMLQLKIASEMQCFSRLCTSHEARNGVGKDNC